MTKAAWKLVCAPKDEGGLGVIDLEKHNRALLLKNLYKFFNKLDIPWVQLVWEKHYKNSKLPSHTRKGSFWWKDILKLLQVFKSIASAHISSGTSVLFWHDSWLHTGPLASSNPELFYFVRNKQITAQKAFEANDFTDLVHLPLSLTAFQQLQEVQQAIDGIATSDANDKWHYCWGSDRFASAKVYRRLTGHHPIHPAFRWLWKNCCQPKHKVFFWLLLKDRLSTMNILRRRNMQLDSYTCALCNSLAEETVEHLFLNCPFAAHCWNMIQVDIPLQSSFPGIIDQIKDQLNSPFFMEAIILLA